MFKMFFVGIVAAEKAGLAMMASQQVIMNSKDALVSQVEDLLVEFKLDDFLVGENKLTNVRLTSVQLVPDDIRMWIEGDRIKLHLEGFGGQMQGHSWKKRWFDEENFDFSITIQRGGFKHIDLEF